MTRTPLSGTQHALKSGEYEAVIASVGASLRRLTHHGRDLVVPFDADEVRPSYRGATLAPWPNRVVDGEYRAHGRDLRLSLTEPSRAQALHGLASWLDFAAIDQRADRVMLEAVLQPEAGYPWRIVVRTTYTLDAGGLRQTVTARNDSDEAAPWGTGPHPYLVAGDAPLDEWTLELPARQVLTVTDERLSPVGLEQVDAADPDRFDFRAPRALGAVEIDHAFTDLQRHDDGTAVVRVTDAAGRGVEMSWDTACPWVQIHTADKPDPAENRLGLAVEPMTCAPDAFNDARYPFDTGLQMIEPGQASSASWRIAAIV